MGLRFDPLESDCLSIVMLKLNQPTENVFTEFLHLQRLGTDRTVACWTEFSHNRTWICRSMITEQDNHRLASLRLADAHHAGFLTADEDAVYWLELAPDHSSIKRWAHDATTPTSVDVVCSAAARCLGQFSVTTGRHGEQLLLAESFQEQSVGLQLIDSRNGRVLRDIHTETINYRRPTCATAPNGSSVFAWDGYDRKSGRYNCHVLPEPDAAIITVPTDHDAQDTFPAVLCTDDSRIVLAHCREVPVWLGSAVTYHSQLCAHKIDSGTVQPIASIPVDFAMNPWLAPYWGHRRFPMLRRNGDSVYLLWEEKLDPEIFPPAYGRLCGLSLSADEKETAPFILASGSSHYGVEQAADADRIWITDKTQHVSFDFQLPWECELTALTAEYPKRESVDDNGKLDRVQAARNTTKRPRLDHTDYSLFWGDPHMHSRRSKDLDGEADELFSFARDFAQLDFAVLTENDCTRFTDPLSGFEWECICRDAALFDEPGNFSCFAGWEYTEHQNENWPGSTNEHRSVILDGDHGTLSPCYRAENRPVSKLVQHCRDRGEAPLIHLHTPCESYTPNELEANIEICSGWGNRMRHPQQAEFVHRVLLDGARLGFIGCSDNHERNPGMGGGLTGVWAEDNTRAALLAAFRARRVYATTGVRAELRFWLNDTFMGGIATATGHAEIRVEVQAETPVERIDLIRDGQIVHSEACNDTHVSLQWRDPDFDDDATFYYPHVIFHTDHPQLPWDESVVLPFNLAPAIGRDAWASPVFMKQGNKGGTLS